MHSRTAPRLDHTDTGTRGRKFYFHNLYRGHLVGYRIYRPTPLDRGDRALRHRCEQVHHGRASSSAAHQPCFSYVGSGIAEVRTRTPNSNRARLVLVSCSSRARRTRTRIRHRSACTCSCNEAYCKSSPCPTLSHILRPCSECTKMSQSLGVCCLRTRCRTCGIRCMCCCTVSSFSRTSFPCFECMRRRNSSTRPCTPPGPGTTASTG